MSAMCESGASRVGLKVLPVHGVLGLPQELSPPVHFVRVPDCEGNKEHASVCRMCGEKKRMCAVCAVCGECRGRTGLEDLPTSFVWDDNISGHATRPACEIRKGARGEGGDLRTSFVRHDDLVAADGVVDLGEVLPIEVVTVMEPSVRRKRGRGGGGACACGQHDDGECEHKHRVRGETTTKEVSTKEGKRGGRMGTGGRSERKHTSLHTTHLWFLMKSSQVILFLTRGLCWSTFSIMMAYASTNTESVERQRLGKYEGGKARRTDGSRERKRENPNTESRERDKRLGTKVGRTESEAERWEQGAGA